MNPTSTARLRRLVALLAIAWAVGAFGASLFAKAGEELRPRSPVVVTSVTGRAWVVPSRASDHLPVLVEVEP